MKKLKWYYNHGAEYELFSVLYEDEDFILVMNDNTKNYNFGLKKDFGTFCGFPVNQSCLTLDELENQLLVFISIDKQYLSGLGKCAAENITRWENMINAAKSRVKNLKELQL